MASKLFECSKCQTTEVKWSELKEHFIRSHVSPERAPWRCSLCGFKAGNYLQIYRHVNHHRHRRALKKMGRSHRQVEFIQSKNPYNVKMGLDILEHREDRPVYTYPSIDYQHKLTREWSPELTRHPEERGRRRSRQQKDMQRFDFGFLASRSLSKREYNQGIRQEHGRQYDPPGHMDVRGDEMEEFCWREKNGRPMEFVNRFMVSTASSTLSADPDTQMDVDTQYFLPQQFEDSFYDISDGSSYVKDKTVTISDKMTPFNSNVEGSTVPDHSTSLVSWVGAMSDTDTGACIEDRSADSSAADMYITGDQTSIGQSAQLHDGNVSGHRENTTAALHEFDKQCIAGGMYSGSDRTGGYISVEDFVNDHKRIRGSDQRRASSEEQQHARVKLHSTKEQHVFAKHATGEQHGFDKHSTGEQHGFAKHSTREHHGFDKHSIGEQHGFDKHSIGEQHGFAKHSTREHHGFDKHSIGEQHGFDKHSIGEQHGFDKHSTREQYGFDKHSTDEQHAFDKHSTEEQSVHERRDRQPDTDQGVTEVPSVSTDKEAADGGDDDEEDDADEPDLATLEDKMDQLIHSLEPLKNISKALVALEYHMRKLVPGLEQIVTASKGSNKGHVHKAMSS